MKISDEKLKQIIRESVRQKAIEEGFFDDAVDFVADKAEKAKSYIKSAFSSMGEFFDSLGDDVTSFSGSIINDLKKSGEDFIKDSIKSKSNQEDLTEMIKYFSDQEDIKEFLKSNAKHPEKIDGLFNYLQKKNVNIEDLAVKIAGKLIESGTLDIDLSLNPPVYIKKDEDAPSEIADALITSMEELDANFGLDFFTGGKIKSKRKLGKKLEKGATKIIIRRKLKKLFED
tara:strand:- start:1007 stop:1693 length:687 start_codon:yes stop_codon:yes gene_type:complete